jgi:HK97 family phage major capsid protein
MNKEQYLAQRKALLDEAEVMIGEGKTEDANAKLKEAEALDNKWEAVKLANANMEALKGKNTITDLSTKTENIEGKVIENMGNVVAVIDEKKQYENAWAKVMQGKKLENNEQVIFDKVNSQFENAYTHTTGNTPTLIPENVVAGIWARATEMYPFFADAKKYNVQGTFTMNKHDVIAAGDAAWYDEATATADEQNTFGQLTLTGCELSKSITVTWKMRAMATSEFIPYIQNELGQRVGVALGTSAFKGKGQPGTEDTFKAEPLGVETALAAEADTPQVVTYNPDASTPVPLTYAKITTAISKVHSSYLSGSDFYANNATIWTQLANIVDDNGRPIFIPDASQGGVGMMLGFVVKADAGVTANNIVFGNPGAAYIVNTNEPMSLATEEHVKARTVDYAAYTIVDGGVLDTKAFALIKKSA